MHHPSFTTPLALPLLITLIACGPDITFDEQARDDLESYSNTTTPDSSNGDASRLDALGHGRGRSRAYHRPLHVQQGGELPESTFEVGPAGQIVLAGQQDLGQGFALRHCRVGINHCCSLLDHSATPDMP